jgi:hypothetical protein
MYIHIANSWVGRAEQLHGWQVESRRGTPYRNHGGRDRGGVRFRGAPVSVQPGYLRNTVYVDPNLVQAPWRIRYDTLQVGKAIEKATRPNIYERFA